MALQPNYWRKKPLAAMTQEEWEALCDGCGKCCLHKLQDIETGELALTNVACRMLNRTTVRCMNYMERKRFVPDCTQLTPKNVKDFDWLPDSCAYRLVAKGHDLPKWHPLKTGKADSTITSGHSVSGKTIAELEAGDLEDHVVDEGHFTPKR